MDLETVAWQFTVGLTTWPLAKRFGSRDHNTICPAQAAQCVLSLYLLPQEVKTVTLVPHPFRR